MKIIVKNRIPNLNRDQFVDIINEFTKCKSLKEAEEEISDSKALGLCNNLYFKYDEGSISVYHATEQHTSSRVIIKVEFEHDEY